MSSIVKTFVVSKPFICTWWSERIAERKDASVLESDWFLFILILITYVSSLTISSPKIDTKLVNVSKTNSIEHPLSDKIIQQNVEVQKCRYCFNLTVLVLNFQYEYFKLILIETLSICKKNIFEIWNFIV